LKNERIGSTSGSGDAVGGRPTSDGQGMTARATNDGSQYTNGRNVFEDFLRRIENAVKSY